MRRVPALCALSALVLVLGATPARADSRKEFRSGFLAFERGSWEEVERRMAAAIEERPQEDARDLIRISGTFSKAYLPWYYLGVARAELGRCAEAMEAFDRSLAQRAILSAPEHGDLVGRRAKCVETPPAEVDESDSNPALPAPAPPAHRPPVEPSEIREPVPPSLVEAATAFFSGDYRGCLARLADLAPEPAGLRAQVELFRAASEFALARAGDEDSGDRLRRARAAARRYRAAASGAAPGERYFSPEFLAFLAGG